MINVFVEARASGLAPTVPATAFLVGVALYANDGVNVKQAELNVLVPFAIANQNAFNAMIETNVVAWVRLQTIFGWNVGGIRMFYQQFSEANG